MPDTIESIDVFPNILARLHLYGAYLVNKVVQELIGSKPFA